MDLSQLVPTSANSLIVHAIQEVAPFLPLITTGLCESHVAAALDNGLLYPAATPMTIFGSLGVAMAGVIALLASIDWPFVRFHGPTHLKNAGLQPTGLGTLLLHVNERKHHLHVAEDRLRILLSKKKVRSVDINLLSPDLLWWNVRLVFWTAVLSTLGIIPYIPLFTYSLPDRPFHETWLAPLLRIFGTAIVAVSVQFLFQLRLLDEAYHRLRFLAADAYLKDAGTSLPSFWDPNQRSKSVFAQLRQWLDSQPKGGPAQSPELTVRDAAMFLNKIHRLRSFKFEGKERSTAAPAQPTADGEAGTTAAPTAQPHTRASHRASTRDFNDAEEGTSEPIDREGAPDSPSHSGDHTGTPQETRVSVNAVGAPQETPAHLDEIGTPRLALWIAHLLTTLGLGAVQLLLLIGVGCIVYGYVLCFSLVQVNRSSDAWAGPVWWMVLEVLLALVRIAIWAHNPDWDDPRSPIVLEKVSKEGGDESARDNAKCSYGIGWSLNSLTADDMHALVIGIDKYGTWDLPEELGDLNGAVNDADNMGAYLEETLHVPGHQIHTLRDSDATKERIVNELKELSRRTSVAKDAPIVIYYAGHSWVSSLDNCTYLVPSHPNYVSKHPGPESNMLKYGDIVEMLRHIGNEKTENIVLILDTCHAGAMALRSPSPEPLGNRTPTTKSQEESIATNAAVPSMSGGDTSLDLGATASNPGSPPTNGGSTRPAPRQQSTAATGVSKVSQTKARDILTGHPSHVLLAAAAPDQQALEASDGQGGKFTETLLEVLKEPKDKYGLKSMTYKKLIDEIGNRPIRVTTTTGDSLDWNLKKLQRVHCTTIHQERPLFDGLFARKRDNDSAVPVVTVQYYSD